MKAKVLRILTLIQVIIFLVFTISQMIFFDSLWTGSYSFDVSRPLMYIMSPMSSFYLWPAIALFSISMLQLYLLKIRQTLIFGLLANTLTFYVIFPVFRLFPYFNYSIIIPLFTISSLYLIFYSYALYLILVMAIKSQNEEEITLIKKTIGELGTQFTRLEVREISEDCQVDQDLIIKVIIEMISNNEIHAEYFKSSKTVAFNQEANIEEMDNLI